MTNEWSFEQIYALFQPKIHRYLTRLAGNKDADDLTQEVFIKIEAGLKTFRYESKLSTWIYRIATNTAVDRLRNHALKLESAVELSDDIILKSHTYSIEQGLAISGSKFSSEEAFACQETSECIRRIIEKLPENYRAIVILSELEGLRNREIAEIVNLSLDAVKIHLHRGKARLKKELAENCELYWDERNELTCDPKAPFKNDV